MNRQQLAERIAKRVLVADGAMGTLLVSRGFPATHHKGLGCLEVPELVAEIHQDYASAGAQILRTNSFDSNRVKLAAIGRENDLVAVNREAVRLAREAAEGEWVLVGGSVGPLGLLVRPYGTLSVPDVRALYVEQIRILVEAGIDLVVLEALGSLLEASEAVRAARQVAPDMPVVALVTFTHDGLTRLGESPARVFAALAVAGADVVGASCTLGPEETLEAIREAAASCPAPLALVPNAGYPTVVGGRSLFLSSPDYVAAFAAPFVEAGAVLLGGCCGTTPEHVRALVAAADGLSPARRSYVDFVEPDEPAEAPSPAAENAPTKSSLFRRKLGHEPLFTSEIDPPRGADPSVPLRMARDLASLGVDAVAVPDNPNARLRMSPVAFAHLVEREAGLSTIVHFTCRNRNLLGIQSELLGASALGLRTILALTGDPAAIGDYPQATRVRDVDSIGLARIVRGLNSGLDTSRGSIGTPTDFLVGSDANPASVDPDAELTRMQAKVDAGVRFFLTRPLFDVEAVRRFLARPGGRSAPILVSILPFRNYRQALFTANEIPDQPVPPELLSRLREASLRGPAAEGEEALAIALETTEALAPIVDGIHVVPNGRPDTVGPILAAARAARRPAPEKP